MKIEVAMMRARATELKEKEAYFRKIGFDRLAGDFKKDWEFLERAAEIIDSYDTGETSKVESIPETVSAPSSSEERVEPENS